MRRQINLRPKLTQPPAADRRGEREYRNLLVKYIRGRTKYFEGRGYISRVCLRTCVRGIRYLRSNKRMMHEKQQLWNIEKQLRDEKDEVHKEFLTPVQVGSWFGAGVGGARRKADHRDSLQAVRRQCHQEQAEGLKKG